MSDESLNGHFMICQKCEKRIERSSEFEFHDVYSDAHGRDVIKFRCNSCGEQTESFAYRT